MSDVKKFCLNTYLTCAPNGLFPRTVQTSEIIISVTIIVCILLPWVYLTSKNNRQFLQKKNEYIFGNKKTPTNVTRYFFYTLYTGMLSNILPFILPLYFMFQHVCRGYFRFGVMFSMIVSSFLFSFMLQTNVMTDRQTDDVDKTESISVTRLSFSPLWFLLLFMKCLVVLSIFQHTQTLWIPILAGLVSGLVNTIIYTVLVFFSS